MAASLVRAAASVPDWPELEAGAISDLMVAPLAPVAGLVPSLPVVEQRAISDWQVHQWSFVFLVHQLNFARMQIRSPKSPNPWQER